MEKFIENGKFDSNLMLFTGQCDSEPPSADLYTYAGNLKIEGDNIALDVNQLLLNGAELKNTDWVIAFCVYTGNETRLMKN